MAKSWPLRVARRAFGLGFFHLMRREARLPDLAGLSLLLELWLCARFCRGTARGWFSVAIVRTNPATQESQLMLWSGETHNEEPLTTASHLGRAPTDWSPDGKFLLMIQDNNNTGREEIWQLPVAARPHAEGGVRRIISNPEYDLDEGQYSRDGRWIVFEGLRNQPQGLETTLYVMAATGGAWIRITDGKHLVLTPRWSPDGKTIYFVSGRSDFFNVWGIRFDPTKGKPVRHPFSVTELNSLSLMVPRQITGSVGLSLTQDRLVLPLAQESGGIWMLDG